MHVQKSGYLQLAVEKKKKLCLSVTLLTISLYRINVLNDYMRFFTGLYCDLLI